MVDSVSGNLFIADTNNSRIREVSPGGIITTVAGNGCCGYSGDGQLATSAALTYPQGVAVDSSGNIYIADTGNNVVRKVSTSGIITTIAGSIRTGGLLWRRSGPAVASLLYAPAGVAVNAAGDLFIADTVNNVIPKDYGLHRKHIDRRGHHDTGFAGDWCRRPRWPNCTFPQSVFVDASGNLYIADSGNNRIRKVSTSGTITTVAGNGTGVSSGDGGTATAAGLPSPTSIALDTSGDIFVAVPLNSRIREVSAGGTITTVAGEGVAGFFGDGGAPTNALLNHPAGVAVDASGDIFIADTGNNRVREVSASSAPPPSITSGGVVAVDSTVATIQPGEFVSIYGTNLGPASPATWTGIFVTTLGGTSVTIDGNPAYLTYAGPTQISAQAPNDSNTTSHTVNVAALQPEAGTTTSTVTLAQCWPRRSSCSTTSTSPASSSGRMARGLQGGGDLRLTPGQPETRLGFQLGCRESQEYDPSTLRPSGLDRLHTQQVPAGQPFSSSGAQTTNPVNLLINNISVPPSFAGIDSSLLYQINLTVPAGLGTGDVPLSAMVGGFSTQTGVVISLQ